MIFIITRGLIHNQNVILLTPCGSGKSLIFKMGVLILKKIKNVDNGIGICLYSSPNCELYRRRSNCFDILKLSLFLSLLLLIDKRMSSCIVVSPYITEKYPAVIPAAAVSFP